MASVSAQTVLRFAGDSSCFECFSASGASGEPHGSKEETNPMVKLFFGQVLAEGVNEGN